MTEVHVVRHDNSHRYKGELEQYFRGRYDVFVRERGWKDLERPDGRDIDQFDTEDAIHLLPIEGSQVIGGFRFNPSTGPTLLNQVFPELSLMPLVGSPYIYELTRLWVVKEKRGRCLRPAVDSLLMAGCLELALALGLRKLRSMCETWRISRNLNIGWTLRPLGLPQDINGHNCIAIEKDVSEAIWIEVCRHLSVPGPVLIWDATVRPSYRLPELVPAAA